MTTFEDILIPRHWTYSAFMLAAMVSFVLIRRSSLVRPCADRVTHPKSRWLPMAAFVGGMFGAKLPFLLIPDEVNSTSAIGWFADGKTVVTGIIGAYVTVELLKAILGIRDRTGDTFALPLAVAMSIGRLGCYFNGCCAGNETKLAVGVDFGDGLKRHPVQLYESLFHLALAVIVLLNRNDVRLKDQQLKFYLLCYCLFRFVTEYLRPAPRLAAGLTFYQYTVMVLAAGLLLQWRYHARQKAERV
jgi:phosphatidylglycerol:prolipoprotein diacylglycerol transferase